MPAIGGSVSIEGEAQKNCQSASEQFSPLFDQLRIDVGGHAKASGVLMVRRRFFSAVSNHDLGSSFETRAGARSSG